MAPAEIVSDVNFDQWSGDMALGSYGLMAIHAWQGVSSPACMTIDLSSRKVRVRPLLMEPAMVLDNGTPERPWRITMSIRSKAAWFRAQNSVYSESSDFLPEH